MVKKILKKHQTVGVVKKTNLTPINIDELQKEWNKKERIATNPKNKKTIEQLQKEWNESERTATNPKNKKTIKMELYKKGGVTKLKKK